MRVHQRASEAVSVCVDRVSWALTRNGEAFVRAELQGFGFHTARDRDHTGTTKVPADFESNDCFLSFARISWGRATCCFWPSTYSVLARIS